MKQNEMIWAALLHIGSNMWRDKDAPVNPDEHFRQEDYTLWSDTLVFDRDVFHRILEKMPELGINTVLLDVGDGVRYDSHPEIGVEGSLTPDELRNEVRYIRSLGLEPVPKLNFSAGHDAWLRQYEKMVTTEIYHNVVSDLVHEVCQIFEGPKYFHLGMDEEREENQRAYGCSIIRGEDLWWRDFYRFIGYCEKENARPWIWSDYFWDHRETFPRKMPKTVLQSNWHYWNLIGKDGEKGPHGNSYRAFFDLAELGYDQVPATTTWSTTANTDQVVDGISAAGLPNILGFMACPWQLTVPVNYYDILGDVARLTYAKERYGDRFQ